MNGWKAVIVITNNSVLIFPFAIIWLAVENKTKHSVHSPLHQSGSMFWARSPAGRRGRRQSRSLDVDLFVYVQDGRRRVIRPSHLTSQHYCGGQSDVCYCTLLNALWGEQASNAGMQCVRACVWGGRVTKCTCVCVSLMDPMLSCTCSLYTPTERHAKRPMIERYEHGKDKR